MTFAYNKREEETIVYRNSDIIFQSKATDHVNCRQLKCTTNHILAANMQELAAKNLTN